MSGETLKLREASVEHVRALAAWELAMDIRRRTSVEVRKEARRQLDFALRQLELAALAFAAYDAERRERSRPLAPVDWEGAFRDHPTRPGTPATVDLGRPPAQPVDAGYRREVLGEYREPTPGVFVDSVPGEMSLVDRVKVPSR